jgi:hypothetical protein
MGQTTSGVYDLLDADSNIYQNYCDMESGATGETGGWTLVVKVLEGSSTMHRTNTAQWRDGTTIGSVATLADENALGKSYENVAFTDVMIRTIGTDQTLQSGKISWRHPNTYTNFKSVVNACTRVTDGALIEGSFTSVACDTQNTQNSIRSDCHSLMNMCTDCTPQYGFFLAEGAPGGSTVTGGCSGTARTDYAGSVVGGGVSASSCGSCLSSWGVGSGYGGTSTSGDQGYGINYHWWGAGNYRLGTDIPIRTVGVFVR